MKPRTFGLLDLAFLAGCGLAGRGLYLLLPAPWLYLLGGLGLMTVSWIAHTVARSGTK